MRRFFIDNALFWSSEFHLDALRLDAVHAIVDFSPQPFWPNWLHGAPGSRALQPANLSDSGKRSQRYAPGAVSRTWRYGLDAQWNDDFHHALHTLLTGEQTGYYADFGRVEQLAKAWREGFVYSGEYSPYRRRRHGSSSRDIAAERLVVFSQNHDQVGNRMGGERLSQLVRSRP